MFKFIPFQFSLLESITKKNTSCWHKQGEENQLLHTKAGINTHRLSFTSVDEPILREWAYFRQHTTWYACLETYPLLQ